MNTLAFYTFYANIQFLEFYTPILLVAERIKILSDALTTTSRRSGMHCFSGYQSSSCKLYLRTDILKYFRSPQMARVASN